MKRYHLVFVGMVAMVTLSISASVGFARDDKFTGETLRGIKGFSVSVGSLKPEIERKGLTRDQIKADVELKLRLAGIKVLTDAEWDEEIGRPWIFVQPTVFEMTQYPAFLYSINIKVFQIARLIRTGEFDFVATWYRDFVGITSRLSRIRNTIKDQMDIFLNAYLSVNPKQ